MGIISMIISIIVAIATIYAAIIALTGTAVVLSNDTTQETISGIAEAYVKLSLSAITIMFGILIAHPAYQLHPAFGTVVVFIEMYLVWRWLKPKPIDGNIERQEPPSIEEYANADFKEWVLLMLKVIILPILAIAAMYGIAHIING